MIDLLLGGHLGPAGHVEWTASWWIIAAAAVCAGLAWLVSLPGSRSAAARAGEALLWAIALGALAIAAARPVWVEEQGRTEIPNVLEAVLMANEGGSRLQLAQRTDRSGPIDMGTAMWKLYVNTDNCQRIYDRAIAAGCESVTPPARLDRWPVTVAFIKDFDGYLIEFVEYHDDTPPGVPKPTVDPT